MAVVSLKGLLMINVPLAVAFGFFCALGLAIALLGIIGLSLRR